MGFNSLKDLLYIVSSMNVFNQNYFQSTNSLKSNEINRLYEKFNRLILLKPDYISCVFESRCTIMSFLARKLVIHHWKTPSLHYTAAR